MAFFPKKLGKLFGYLGKSDVAPGDVRAMQDARAAQAAREREARAKREADEARKFINQLSEQGRRIAGQRAAEAEAERIRAKVMQLAAQESAARERARRAGAEADMHEARLRVWESMQQSMREDLMRERGRFNPNKNTPGRGEIPDLPEFMRGVPYSRFASSNVATLQYDRRHQTLYVQFLRKGTPHKWYRVENVNKNLAIEFFSAASKGVLYWARVRRPGMRVEPVSGPPSDLPLPASAAAFGA